MKHSTLRETVVVAVLFSATLACGSEENTDRAVNHDASAQPPSRIVSLIPSATETIIALGAGERLVARTDYDTDPALAHLPSVGGGLTPSLEYLATLEPELVVAWPDNMSRSISTRLADLGVELYMPQAQSLADIYKVTGDLGRLLGLEARADSLNDSIRQGLEELRAAVAGRERPSVFYVVWHEPPTTAGRGTYIDELIEIVGARNLFADAPTLWPQLSLEEIVRRQPDVLVFPRGEGQMPELEELRTLVGWRDLRAVQEGEVVEVDAFLFNRPGPRVVEAARQLAIILHPEAFSAASVR